MDQAIHALAQSACEYVQAGMQALGRHNVAPSGPPPPFFIPGSPRNRDRPPRQFHGAWHLECDTDIAQSASIGAEDALRGPLETDVREAAATCWTLERREVTVRSAFKLRSQTLMLHEAKFNVDAETQLLGAAFNQWQLAAQGRAASAALETRTAERRLLHAVFQ